MGLVGERALYGQGCMKGALEVILQGETTTKRKKTSQNNHNVY